jgi:hypothetical protein
LLNLIARGRKLLGKGMKPFVCKKVNSYKKIYLNKKVLTETRQGSVYEKRK